MLSEKASTVLGAIGTVCWCIQLLPQIYYNYRRKNCEGVPPLMMFLWAFCGVPFAIYFIASRGNLAVQVQPEIFFVFCLTTFVQSLYYPPVAMSKKKILAIIIAFIGFDVGCQVGFIIWLRPLYDRGITWPTLIFGIIASVALAVGLIPPYLELAKRNGRVVGINLWFIFIDCSGAIFSMLSVVVGNMDVMGIILYCICGALEIGIMLSHLIWCIRFKWFRKVQVHDEEDQQEQDLSLDIVLRPSKDSNNELIGEARDTDPQDEEKNSTKVEEDELNHITEEIRTINDCTKVQSDNEK